MQKRRLVLLAVSAMLLTSFSMPDRSVEASNRTAGMRSMQRTSTLAASEQVQWTSPFHAGGCHENDAMAYDPADD